MIHHIGFMLSVAESAGAVLTGTPQEKLEQALTFVEENTVPDCGPYDDAAIKTIASMLKAELGL